MECLELDSGKMTHLVSQHQQGWYQISHAVGQEYLGGSWAEIGV